MPSAPRSFALVGRFTDPRVAESAATAATHLATRGIATLVVDHTEDMIRIVSIATREPEGWVAGLRSDDFTDLATVVFRVNASFFLQRVMPKLAEIAPALNLILALGAGLESSPTSESEVTQAPKT